jgi:hypothetical protein
MQPLREYGVAGDHGNHRRDRAGWETHAQLQAEANPSVAVGPTRPAPEPQQ